MLIPFGGNMLYIVTALYAEAKPIIQHYQLRKLNTSHRLQLFTNEEQQISLIISGIGPSASSIATTFLITQFQANHQDKIINLGVCGAVHNRNPIGTPILAHKIIEHHTSYSYYPDILIKHPFIEGSVETFLTPVLLEQQDEIQGEYVDMECSGFYQAASTFLAPHQIYSIKIISDYLQVDEVDAKQVSYLIQNNLDVLDQFFQSIRQHHSNEEKVFTPAEEELLSAIADNLRISTTMRHELFRLALQYKIGQQQDFSVLDSYKVINVKNKQEGKNYFEQIKKQLLFS